LTKVSQILEKPIMRRKTTDRAPATTKRKAEEAPDIENSSKRLKQSPTPFDISKPGNTRKEIRIVPFPEKARARHLHL